VPPSSKPERAQDSPDPRPDDAQAARRLALDLLARREHSRAELQRKLLARCYPPGVIAELLDTLEGEGLLAESRFLESFVRTRIGKGQGPARIRADLVRRGIEEARARAWLGEGEFDWEALAAEVRVKRFGAQPPRDFKERARQARFLQYRGFEGGQINAALDIAEDSD
jgi:regulatory protein